MSEMKLLWEMQQLNLKKIALEKQLKSSPVVKELTQLKVNIKAVQEELKEKKEVYDREKKHLKQKEDAAAGLREKIEALNNELYSGQHNNAKELTGVTAKLDDLKEKLKILDDEAIIFMEKIEELKQTILGETAALNSNKDRFRQLRDDYLQQKNSVSAEINAIPARQNKLGKGVTAEKMTIFRQLSDNFPDGMVIAGAAKGICAGCHMGVSFDIMKHLKLDDKIIYCDHCGRILLPMD